MIVKERLPTLSSESSYYFLVAFLHPGVQLQCLSGPLHVIGLVLSGSLLIIVE